MTGRAEHETQSLVLYEEPVAETSPVEARVKLIRDTFSLGDEAARDNERRFWTALGAADEAKAAGVLTGLVYSLNPEQKREQLALLREKSRQPEVKGEPGVKLFVDRLLWTFEELLQEPRSPEEAVANRFKDAVRDNIERIAGAAKSFGERVKAAAGGDKAALAGLLEDYGPKTLIDFMLAQRKHRDGALSVQLAKALGWRDPTGTLHLDVVPPTGGEPLTLTLGSTDDEIKRALDAFGEPQPHDPPGATLKGAALAAASAGRPKHFFRLGQAPPDPVKGKQPTRTLEPYTAHLLDPEDTELCQEKSPATVHETPTQKRPNYFIRPFAGDDYAGYAGGNSKNYILNLKNGEELEVPGQYDPVPSPDDRFLTVPDFGKDEGMAFFDIEALKDGDRAPMDVHLPNGRIDSVDPEMRGNYQSMGVLSKGGPCSPSDTRYRMIAVEGVTGVRTRSKRFRMRDYKVRSSPRGNHVEPQNEIIELCHNLTNPDGSLLDLSLPMLSKDGRELAALDVEAGVTKIYTLADDGTCTETLNLGIFTGKIDFSFDGKLLTFHKFNYEAHGKSYYDVPSSSLVGNVYVYNRETNRMSKLTNNTHGNAVYPAFRADGKIVYIQHPHGANGRDANQPASKLVIADPKLAPSRPFDIFRTETDAGRAKVAALAAIGGVWSRLCLPSAAGEDTSLESAAMQAAAMSPEKCRKLVQKYWNRMRDTATFRKQIRNFKQGDFTVEPDQLRLLASDDLEKACPKARAAWSSPGGPPSPGGPRPLEELINSCRGCHSQAFVIRDLAKLRNTRFTVDARGQPVPPERQMPLVERILQMLAAMPPPPAQPYYSPQEQEMLRNYLKGAQ